MMAGEAARPASVLQRRLSLLGGLIREAGPVPNERHLHWLCFAAQELGAVPREFQFVVRGGEAFSAGLDATLGVMEALDLLVDTHTGSSLVLTDRGRKLVPQQSLPVGALSALPTTELVDVGRCLYLSAAGVPDDELARTYQLRFWADSVKAEGLVKRLAAFRDR
jgi:hypothetical protein